MSDAACVAIVPLVEARALSAPLHYDGPDLAVGDLASIPLGPRRVRGLVVATGVEPEVPASSLRRAEPTGLSLPPDLALLALDLAERYATAPARVVKLLLPPTTAPRTERWLRSVGDAARGARQQAVLRALEDGPLPVDVVRAATGASAAVVRRMAEAGLVAVEDAPATNAAARDGHVLTAEQEIAVERLDGAIAARNPDPLLLFGVTGSGKTEVFLRGLETALAAGRGAIVLVPEIALAPQTAGRIVDRFGDGVAVLHSAQAAGVRARAYDDLRSGRARVVIGPRSAVFAPLADLGLIVIDEEHEGSYKQESDPRYDARAVAMLRARAHGAAVLLASATPRPESWHHVARVELPRRVQGGRPHVRAVDLRVDGDYPLSRPLQDELARLGRGGGRAILLLNRRGQAPALHCRACGTTTTCRNCDVALTLHRAQAALVCHHCGDRRAVPSSCPVCGAVDLAQIGAGTERLEELLEQRFPDLRTLRLDRDVIARRGALEQTLDEFASTDRAVLVGTQLVAKGHHFEGVRLAAVIDADVGLAVPDFRAEERTFNLIVQLAGRAGRDADGARVLVQSFEPDERAIRLAVEGQVAEFLDGELARREALRYPPFSRLVRVLVTTPDGGRPLDLLDPIAAAARASLTGDDVLGPAPLLRLRGRARAHLLVKAASSRRAARVLGALAAEHSPRLRRADATIVVDVDPQSL